MKGLHCGRIMAVCVSGADLLLRKFVARQRGIGYHLLPGSLHFKRKTSCQLRAVNFTWHIEIIMCLEKISTQCMLIKKSKDSDTGQRYSNGTVQYAHRGVGQVKEDKSLCSDSVLSLLKGT